MSDDESASDSNGAADDTPGWAAEGTADQSESKGERRAEPEPTPQPAAFRRQQLYVGSGIALLAGLAVVVAGIQQFPGLPLAVYLLFGMAATTLLLGFLVANMFRTGDE